MRIRTKQTTGHGTDTVILVVACSCSYKPIARDKLPKLIDQYGGKAHSCRSHEI